MKRDEKRLRDLKKILESLFGDIEEIDGLEAGQLLQSAGIDYESVRRKLYDRLAESAASLRLKGRAVAVDLQQALDAFRPLDAPPRNEDEARRQAHGVLRRFLEQAAQPATSVRFAFSYRNRGELTRADIKLLDSVIDRLRKRVGRKE